MHLSDGAEVEEVSEPEFVPRRADRSEKNIEKQIRTEMYQTFRFGPRPFLGWVFGDAGTNSGLDLHALWLIAFSITDVLII